MYEQEQIKPYGEEGTKREQVEQMFDNIALVLTVSGGTTPLTSCSKTEQARIAYSTLRQALATSLSLLHKSYTPNALWGVTSARG